MGSSGTLDDPNVNCALKSGYKWFQTARNGILEIKRKINVATTPRIDNAWRDRFNQSRDIFPPLAHLPSRDPQSERMDV
jgi:hypothetical protein